MSYEHLERRITCMLEEAQSDDEVFDDVSDEENSPIEFSAAQEQCNQSDSDDDIVPLSSYFQFLNQQEGKYFG